MAIVLILFFPILFGFYEKYGTLVVFSLSILLPLAFRLPYSDFKRWLPCMILGIVFADRDLLPYLRNQLLKKAKVRNFFVSLIILILSIYLTDSLTPLAKGNFVPSTTVLSVGAIITFAYTYLRQRYVWRGLAFLGRHSMNMFLTHTFIRGSWYHNFIYGFKYAWLDTLVLLVITVLLSICIEYLKKITGYNKLLPMN